ncbi:MAG: putative toxin-antitoxin system toxin component, PIN family [Nostoc sp. DedVER02]|uniref:putative toxin-antitoxin system toxin component, PIN family n=1 Tax=unclassified Nostoc TaxID=2593658 RepID=UPI002AD38CFE|nr:MULTISPECIES: putative toxin-antitoxin system toxin component, PIN family [unclassified Nostoc]MDZ7985229.1 putative toxin-antitoxin system toxin component, PIN family [Nostoc sp. DedVER02]MDZ8115167.1 putative toxin-antitoxin system toxin component, PIN family [Nostoc sp. DedVER01b]
MRPIVVFDTNVLLSAIGWKGSPYHCIDMARQGRVKDLICPEILDELTEKLEQKLKFTPIQVIETIADLLTFLRLITIANTLNFLTTDPNDNMVLECAIVGNATHIVTGDKRHLLPLGSYQGIAIVNARDFLNLVIPE